MSAIVGLCRSPFCAINGHLSTLNSRDLLSKVLDSAVKRAHVNPCWVKSAFIAQVLPQSQGICQINNSLVQIGLSNATITTLNTMCNSGLSSIILANMSTKDKDRLGLSLAGGVDSISNAPYLLTNNFMCVADEIKDKFVDKQLLNSVRSDYLSTSFESKIKNFEEIMGKFEITSDNLDKFKITSWKRTLDCLSSNILEQEITPFKVILNSSKRDIKAWINPTERIIHRDDLLGDIPEFEKNKQNTAKLVDGACIVVLSSAECVKRYKLREIVRIIAASECKSETLEQSLKDSFEKCLSDAGLSQARIDVYEIQDQLAYIPLIASKILKLDLSRVNLHGGSFAIGFCPGASGTRLAISLTSVLKSRCLRYGCAISINKLGQVAIMILENPSYN